MRKAALCAVLATLGIVIPFVAFGADAPGEATTPERVFTGPSGELLTVPGQVYTSVTVTAPAPPPPPPPAIAPPYYSEHFDGALSNPFWTYYPGAANFSFVNDRLRISNNSSPSGDAGSGDLKAIWADAQYAHAGYQGSSNGKHETTWYRFRVRFPSALYKPTPGEWNWLFQLHVDGLSETEGSGVDSTSFGVYADGYTGQSLPLSLVGTNPRLHFRTIGGRTTSREKHDWYLKASELNHLGTAGADPLLYDHDYDVVEHIDWGETSASGWAQVWLDGIKVVDAHVPTQFLRNNGTLSYGMNIELMQYRIRATYASALDFDDLVWGPSATSVGFTP